MAMDMRRYQQAREKNPQEAMSISVSTFPALVTIAIGILIIVVGVVLLAAFGVPKDININPKPVSGVVVLGVGLLISFIGICTAIHLKKKADARKREKKRLEQQQKQATEQQNGTQQRQHQQQPHNNRRFEEPSRQLQVSPHGYYNQGSHGNPPAPASTDLYGNKHNRKNDGYHSNMHQQHHMPHGGAVATVYS